MSGPTLLVLIALIFVALVVAIVLIIVWAVRKSGKVDPRLELQRAYEAGVRQAELQRAYEAGLKANNEQGQGKPNSGA
ncbi:hypothetical protein [Leucobacter denitrificans]|uniref:Uncharacterized protein n=1 Tax=Leucobacter denitrificans TaxID=683042 RepID=A0A7G9S5A2_9MICO|nr:hypothetical protein [Leucobacter denitrificans]QNN63027.1 hypothetical protein H9L06_01190 [Leucobacter denitrificans]